MCLCISSCFILEDSDFSIPVAVSYAVLEVWSLEKFFVGFRENCDGRGMVWKLASKHVTLSTALWNLL